MPKPVAIDLCCGLGGWTAGLLAEGWDVIGFDIERHEYGDKRYPADLILKSILEINGYDLRAVNPSLVVASPPCQEFSYMAMPWSRAKQIAGGLRAEVPFPEGYDGSRTLEELTALFDACFRIAREIGCPIVLENVKGAQPWVGRANAHYGSYYLWGDVGNVGGRVVRADRPAKFGEYVRPSVAQKFNPDGTAHGQGSWFAVADSKERGAQKREGRNFHAFENGLGSYPSFNGAEHETRGVKGTGAPLHEVGFNVANAQRYRDGVKHGGDCFNDPDWPGKQGGVKQAGLSGPAWFDQGAASASSKSDSRKAASAMIAEIPFPLAQHIARVFKPK